MNPTDGTRMVAPIASRELGEPVNRKRVQRVMREHKLLQRKPVPDAGTGPATSASPDPTSCGTWT